MTMFVAENDTPMALPMWYEEGGSSCERDPSAQFASSITWTTTSEPSESETDSDTLHTHSQGSDLTESSELTSRTAASPGSIFSTASDAAFDKNLASTRGSSSTPAGGRGEPPLFTLETLSKTFVGGVTPIILDAVNEFCETAAGDWVRGAPEDHDKVCAIYRHLGARGLAAKLLAFLTKTVKLTGRIERGVPTLVMTLRSMVGLLRLSVYEFKLAFGDNDNVPTLKGGKFISRTWITATQRLEECGGKLQVRCCMTYSSCMYPPLPSMLTDPLLRHLSTIFPYRKIGFWQDMISTRSGNLVRYCYQRAEPEEDIGDASSSASSTPLPPTKATRMKLTTWLMVRTPAPKAEAAGATSSAASAAASDEMSASESEEEWTVVDRIERYFLRPSR